MISELYTNIAADGILSSLLIPLRSQTTFFALKAFGEHDTGTMLLAASLAAASSTVGHSINWALGRCILEICKRYKPVSQHATYQKFQRYFLSGGILTLAFSWMPLFGFFSALAGFFNVRLRLALPLLLIGQASFFFYHLQ